MIQRLNLSAKILVTLTPVFVLGVLLSILLDYNFQKETLLQQAKESAQVQSNIIKSSLVNMMVTNLRVNEAYLQNIQTSAGVNDLSVLFHFDSLYLLPEYKNEERTERLLKREREVFDGKSAFSKEIYSSDKPLLIVRCNENTHSPYRLDVTKDQPFLLPKCEYLTVVTPFKAEATCQQCHEVPPNKVLGAAYMELDLEKTASALKMNAFRSIAIFLVFSVFALLIGFFIYNKYIARPVYQLVNATEILGSGNLEQSVLGTYEHDEFGRLAEAFDQMRLRLKEVQQTLLQNERLSTLGQMASGIIHDFRSPMTTISLTMAVLQKNQHIPFEQRQKHYENISITLARMNTMMQELLEYSRGEIKLELQEHNIKEFVRSIISTVEMHLQEKKIKLDIHEECECNAVFDKERLLRALLNIINNSEDAMPNGGTLRVETLRENGSVIIRIGDSGTGIPDEVKETLFEPFVTAGKKRGTGLGLAITKKIIEQHKGEISFTSASQSGTTFSVKIPALG